MPIDVGFDHELPEHLLERGELHELAQARDRIVRDDRPSLRMITSVATRSTLSSTCEL